MVSILNSFLALFNGKNPSNYNHFYDSVDKESIIEKYTLLTYLDNKYKFLVDIEICIEWEFDLFKTFMNIPNDIVDESAFNKYINVFNSYDLNELRQKITLKFICGLFECYLLGECDEYKKFMPLCSFFGKKSLKKCMRRSIYDNLCHCTISNTTINYPLEQTAVLKLYCRFMVLSGKIPDNGLTERLEQYKFAEIPLTSGGDSRIYNTNRKYNKVVRQFNNINMDVGSSVKYCNFINKETKPKFIIFNGLLCKVIVDDDDVDYIMSLEGFHRDTQVEIVDIINDNYDTLVIHTHLKDDKVVLDIKGEAYLTKTWNGEKQEYLVEVAY
jgi:hypothetical protein